MNYLIAWFRTLLADFKKATIVGTPESMASLDRQPVVLTVAPAGLKPPLPAPTSPATPSSSGFAPKILLWASAIAIGEGADPDSNNPGNLKISTLTASWGATKGRPASDGGFLCQFATLQDGQNALCNFLTLACEGELIISNPRPCSFQAFTEKYAGNPPMGYMVGIADRLGISLDTDIATLLD